MFRRRLILFLFSCRRFTAAAYADAALRLIPFAVQSKWRDFKFACFTDLLAGRVTNQQKLANWKTHYLHAAAVPAKQTHNNNYYYFSY